AALPAPRAILADRRVRIFAERGRKRALIAGLRRQARDRRPAAMFERSSKGIMFGSSGRQGRSGRRQCALGRVPPLGSGGAAVFGLLAPRLGSLELGRRRFGLRRGFVASDRKRAAVPQRRNLVCKLV